MARQLRCAMLVRFPSYRNMPGYTDLPGPWRQVSDRGLAIDFTSGHATVTAQ
jgi:hypothetical protein